MTVSNERPEGWAVIPNWLARDGSVTPAAKAVYVALSSRIGREGTCWPSQKTIAHDTGFSVRWVKEAIKDLVKLGVVDVAVQTTNRGRRNIYRVHTGVVQQGSSWVGLPSGQEEEPPEQEPSIQDIVGVL